MKSLMKRLDRKPGQEASKPGDVLVCLLGRVSDLVFMSAGLDYKSF